MNKDFKFILGIIIATIILVGGGVFLLSKKQNKPTPKIDTSILIRSDSNIIKAQSEKAVLVEFGDFQCPACGAYEPIVKKLIGDFKNDLTFVSRNFPLVQHKNARPAAYAAEAAGIQNKYWEMYSLLYENQSKWSSLDDPKSVFNDFAKSLNLDLVKFASDSASSSVKEKVDKDLADGNSLNVNSTPTFYLNGEKIGLPGSYDEFKKMVSDAISKGQIEIAEGEYHAHFDIKIYVNGKAIDLTQDKYQSKEGSELDPDIHLHDGNGKVVHLHKKDVTLGQFFKSLGLGLTGRLFVNGKEVVGDLNNYAPQDLDRVLVTDSKNPELNFISNDACIYSEKCPERGSPPPGDCVGGLGTGCE